MPAANADCKCRRRNRPIGHTKFGGNDMSMKIDGNTLTIEFDPDSEQLSKSGKSYMLGTSGGFKQIEGTNIKVSYNIIRAV
jgi:hypothetical protein